MQALRKRFFRAGEVSWNKGISINISLKTDKERKASWGNILGFFLLDAPKITFWMEHLILRWALSRPFFQKLGTFFDLQKWAGETSPTLPSCAPMSMGKHTSILLNIPKYPWKCWNKLFWLCQDSEYTWSFCMFDRLLKIPRVLNVPGFWIWHGLYMPCLHSFKYVWIWLYASMMPEYDLICLIMSGHFWILLNVPEYPWKCLNKPLWQCQSSQYGSS